MQQTRQEIDKEKLGARCPTGGRDPVIEGFRGLAISLVFLTHFGSFFALQLPPDSATRFLLLHLRSWSLGSSFFLVLTAYFTYQRSLAGGGGNLSYLKRRLFRILPFYWVILAGYIGVAVAFQVHSKVPVHASEAAACIAANLLLLPPLMGEAPIITVSWTLTYIVLAYCLIPVIARALRSVRPQARIFMFVVFGMLFQGFALLSGITTSVTLFVAGMLLYELMRLDAVRRMIERLGEAGSAGALIAAVILATAIADGSITIDAHAGKFIRQFLLCTGICSFCAYRFTHEGPLNRCLESRSLTWLGKRSYSYYLTHGIPIAAVSWGLRAVLPKAQWSAWVVYAALPVCFALSWSLAALCYRLFEAPLVQSSPSPTTAPLPVPNPIVWAPYWLANSLRVRSIAWTTRLRTSVSR